MLANKDVHDMDDAIPRMTGSCNERFDELDIHAVAGECTYELLLHGHAEALCASGCYCSFACLP